MPLQLSPSPVPADIVVATCTGCARRPVTDRGRDVLLDEVGTPAVSQRAEALPHLPARHLSSAAPPPVPRRLLVPHHLGGPVPAEPGPGRNTVR